MKIITYLLSASLILGIPCTADISTPENQTSEVTLIEVPGMSTSDLLSKPKNLSRWHMGAILYDASQGQPSPFSWRDADGLSPALLLGEDPTAELTLSPGIYKYIIELNDRYLISRFTFKNFDAQGSIQLYAGQSLAHSSHQQWQSVGQQVEFSERGYVSSRFEPTESQYLMVVFNITHEGTIGIFGVYGDMSLAEVRMPKTHETVASTPPPNEVGAEETTKFNFASITSGARVTHVSGGELNTVNSVVDDDVETFYAFPADGTEDVIIIDMAEQRDINRISTLFDSGPGVINIYLTNDLPPSALEQEETAGGDLASRPAADDTASIKRTDLQLMAPRLLLASSPGALGEYLALATLYLTPGVQKVKLPQSFFDDTPTSMTFVTDGSDNRLRIDFDNVLARYLVLRFIPSPDVPNTKSFCVYEIGVFGDVPEDRRRLVRTPLFEFSEAAAEFLPQLGNPPVGNIGGGGSDPRPPPPVSP